MAPALTLESTQLDAVDKSTLKANVAQSEVKENYEGQYQFAPIEESQVSRAMIKRFVVSVSNAERTLTMILRYFNTMYERAVSDVVIVGAGSAGLSCAYNLATRRPDVSPHHET